MSKTFRAHPLMIFNFLKPFLFILLLPVVRGIIQYSVSGEYDSILHFEIMLLIVLLVFGFLRWWCFKLIFNEQNQTITVISGLFFRKIAKINIKKLSSVQTKQNPLEFIFRAVTFRLNTDAGTVNKSDYEFKLSVKASKEVSKLLYGVEEQRVIRYSVFKIANTTINAITTAEIKISFACLRNTDDTLDMIRNTPCIIRELVNITISQYFDNVKFFVHFKTERPEGLHQRVFLLLFIYQRRNPI